LQVHDVALSQYAVLSAEQVAHGAHTVSVDRPHGCAVYRGPVHVVQFMQALGVVVLQVRNHCDGLQLSM